MMCPADNSQAVAQTQGCRDEYVSQRVNEMRCRLGNIPWAFPRMTQFPMSWPLIHALVYDFLKKLGLENTLTVFGVESELKQSSSLIESGWFVKSFLLQPNFHSVLVFLLSQFNSHSDRIRDIIQDTGCSSDAVREAKQNDAERFAEAQRIVEAQGQDGCAVRQSQCQQESEFRRRAIEQQQQQECRMRDQQQQQQECRMREETLRREIQEEIARREMESVCAGSRNRVLENIRAQEQQMDSDSDTEREQCRASMIRTREHDRIVESERLAMEAVLANTRQRIIEDMVARQDTMAQEACNRRRTFSVPPPENRTFEIAQQRTFEIPAQRTFDIPVQRTFDIPAERTFDVSASNRPMNEEELAAICYRAGINLNNSQLSRRQSNDGLGGGGHRDRVVDPRRNQSFRAIHRNQHTGWRMEPLGDIGFEGPSIVVTDDADETYVCEPVDEEEDAYDEDHCENHPQAQSVSHASRIPVIYRPVNTQSLASNARSSRTSEGPRRGPRRTSTPRPTMEAQRCGCQAKCKASKAERDSSDCHFSRRSKGWRRQSKRRNQSLGSIRED